MSTQEVKSIVMVRVKNYSFVIMFKVVFMRFITETLSRWCVKKGNFVNFLLKTLTKHAFMQPGFVLKSVEHQQLLCTSYHACFFSRELQTCNCSVLHSFRINLEYINEDSDIIEHLIDMRNNCGI